MNNFEQEYLSTVIKQFKHFKERAEKAFKHLLEEECIEIQ